MGELEIRVIPKASKNRVKIENGVVKVYINASPEKGKANKSLIKFFRKIVGERVEVVSGEKGRKKRIRFSITKEEFLERIKNAE